MVIGLLCVTSGSTPAFAAARNWSGAGANNLWTTPQNWMGNVAPVAGDIVSFPFGSAQTVNVNNYAGRHVVREHSVPGPRMSSAAIAC